MDNQVFLFGSFTEEEATFFQSSPSKSPAKQSKASALHRPTEVTGFESLQSAASNNGNTPNHSSVQFTATTDLTVQVDSSKVGGQWNTGKVANDYLELWTEDGKSYLVSESLDSGCKSQPCEEPLSGNDHVVKQISSEIPSGQLVHQFTNGMVLERQPLQDHGATIVAENIGSHLVQETVCRNVTVHKSETAGAMEFWSSTSVKAPSETQATKIGGVQNDMNNKDITKYREQDVFSEGMKAEAEFFVSSSENHPKSWAALLGVQPDSDLGHQNLGGQKGRNTTSPMVDLMTSIGKPKESTPVTALTGEIWLRSLQQVEISGRTLQPRGLINTGNLCFLNATLQALLSCTPFLHLLRVLQARDIPQMGYPTLHACSEFFKEFEEVSALEKTAGKVLNDDGGKVSGSLEVGRAFIPTMFETILRNFSPDHPPSGVARNRQEDAQEFLSFAMDHMHEELLRLEGKDLGGNHSSLTAANDGDDWETVGPKNRTAVVRTHTFTESALSDIFGGRLCSVVKTKGNKASATVQPFLLLHLDILPEAVQSVEDALKLFAAPESLEGYRPKTGKAAVVSASKLLKIQSLPRVLILHLMRFSYGANGSSKLHKPVHFPLDLTLGRELLASSSGSGSEGRRYELVATVTHHGKEPSRGHYTADSRQSDGRWLRFDDATVSFVSKNRVLHDQAYLLFYKRVIN